MTILADVLVIGAGSAGCTAAIAAARAGCSVVLVERMGFPGGTGTAVLDTFYAFFTSGEGGRKIVSGLPDLPVEGLFARNSVRRRPNSFGSGDGFTYDPETLKLVWTRLLTDAGVRTILNAVLLETNTAGGRVHGATFAAAGDRLKVNAHSVIDATGDATASYLGGAQFQSDVELQQPATLTFRMTGVDIPKFKTHGRPRLPQMLARGREAGLDLPGNGGSMHESGVPGTVLTALTRVENPNIDQPELSGASEWAGLLQIDDWVTFLTRFIPGFETARLSAIAPVVGIRESRRLLGRQTLTEAHVVSGGQSGDQVALCGAPVEDLATPNTTWLHVGGNGTYGIPFGTLLPQDLEGVVVAGRCLSATHLAHASARSMATCMALGQAAGAAAAIAARTGRPVGEVPISQLRQGLIDDGATLEVA